MQLNLCLQIHRLLINYKLDDNSYGLNPQRNGSGWVDTHIPSCHSATGCFFARPAENYSANPTNVAVIMSNDCMV